MQIPQQEELHASISSSFHVINQLFTVFRHPKFHPSMLQDGPKHLTVEAALGSRRGHCIGNTSTPPVCTGMVSRHCRLLHSLSNGQTDCNNSCWTIYRSAGFPSMLSIQCTPTITVFKCLKKQSWRVESKCVLNNEQKKGNKLALCLWALGLGENCRHRGRSLAQQHWMSLWGTKGHKASVNLCSQLPTLSSRGCPLCQLHLWAATG